MSGSHAPIRRDLTVPCDPHEAFEVFTSGMGTWWDPVYTPDADSFTTIEVEPDGLVTLVHGETRFPVGD